MLRARLLLLLVLQLLLQLLDLLLEEVSFVFPVDSLFLNINMKMVNQAWIILIHLCLAHMLTCLHLHIIHMEYHDQTWRRAFKFKALNFICKDSITSVIMGLNTMCGKQNLKEADRGICMGMLDFISVTYIKEFPVFLQLFLQSLDLLLEVSSLCHQSLLQFKHPADLLLQLCLQKLIVLQEVSVLLVCLTLNLHLLFHQFLSLLEEV